jgi:hypothetical protein
LHVSNDATDLDAGPSLIDEKNRLANGTRVLVDGKTGQVMKHEITYHYSVDFGDETFSHDM